MGISFKESEMIEELREKYLRKLKLLNETIWEKKATQKKINKWLNNFRDDEKIHALYLLTQFIYFNKFQIETLLKSIYRDLYKYKQIESIRLDNNDTLDNEFINQEYKNILSKTRFVTLGNPSESSSELMPLFRKINDLPITLFSHISTIKDGPKNVNHFVFIDDLCGSGTQALRYSDEIIPEIKKTHPRAKFSYFMLLGTKDGKSKVIDESKFDTVASVLDLDSTYKCFDEHSRAFMNKDAFIDAEKIFEFAGSYGQNLMKHFLKENKPKIKDETLERISGEKKFGFGDGQLSIGFHHNTPNNSLPIFWYNDAPVIWVPIFKRVNKKYK